MDPYFKTRLFLKGVLGPLFRGVFLNKKDGARFLDNDEVNLVYSPRNKGLIVDGKSRRMTKKDSFGNILLVGKTGTGKTTFYSLNNIIDLANRDCSMAINDPKGEQYQYTSGYLESMGFRVIKYNLMDPYDSYHFNPFKTVQKEFEIDMVCETIIKAGSKVGANSDSIWNDGAIKILSVVARCLSYGDPKDFTLPELYERIKEFGDMGKGLNEWVANHCVNPVTGDKTLWSEWQSAITGNPDGVMSFILSCLASLKALSNSEIRHFYSDSEDNELNYDLTDFRKEKTAIFYITPPYAQEYFSFSTSLFFRSLFNECMRPEYLDSEKTRPAYIIFDEFGNSFIPEFPSIATTSRGYNMSLSLMVQSIGQIESKYGKSSASAIHGAVNTYMILPSADRESREYFCEMIGKVVEKNPRGLLEPRVDRVEYNLINADEIRRMADGTVLIVSANKNAMKIKITPHYKNSKFGLISKFPEARIRISPFVQKVRR